MSDQHKMLAIEKFWLILLDRANNVIDVREMASGGTAGVVVDIKMLFKAAIEANASGIICVHNHPSGALKPSRPDIEITAKIKDAGKSLDIPLLDHLILAENSYYSFADEGML
jgi:DNA repair protein RadC